MTNLEMLKIISTGKTTGYVKGPKQGGFYRPIQYWYYKDQCFCVHFPVIDEWDDTQKNGLSSDGMRWEYDFQKNSQEYGELKITWHSPDGTVPAENILNKFPNFFN